MGSLEVHSEFQASGQLLLAISQLITPAQQQHHDQHKSALHPWWKIMPNDKTPCTRALRMPNEGNSSYAAHQIILKYSI